MDERDWSRLVQQMRSGDCTPFLGAGACYGTLPTGRQLSETWAQEYRYPFDDRSNLPRVMQYAAVDRRDAVTVKKVVAQQLVPLGPPDFARPGEPHGLLASLPLPVYLTTNYDDFMVKALTAAGRVPSSAICPWYQGAVTDEGMLAAEQDNSPRPERPIVYYLHGSFLNPNSLVLTEEDYLEFLINLTRDKSEDRRQLIPATILRALTMKPLLFIGYSLEDWTFRVLFHGLLRTIAQVQQRRHISVQLAPPADSTDLDRHERARDYLTEYFNQWRISLHWGTAEDFCTELRARLAAAE